MMFAIERVLKWRLAATALACVTLVALCSPAWTDDTYAPGDKVDIDVVDAPLARVVDILANQTSINLIMQTTDEEAQKRVTAHLSRQPIERVLRDVLTAAGVKFSKTPDGTYLIGNSSADAAPAERLSTIVEPLEPEPAQAPVARVRQVRTEIIRLRHSSAQDVLKILIEAAPFEDAFATPMLEVPNSRLVGNTVQKTVFSSDMPDVAPAPPTEDPNAAATRGMNEAGRTPGEFSTSGQYTPRPSQSYPRGTTTGTTGRGTTPPAPSGSQTSTGQGGLTPEGIDFIKAFDVDNSIIVRGEEDGIAELKDLIHMLDVPPKQVEIRARFIEISTNAVDRLGIDWSVDKLNNSFSTSFQPSGNVVVGIVGGNVMATLRAELTSGRGKIVNEPIVSTINNMPATIEVGSEIPLFLKQLVPNGLGGAAEGEQIVYNSITTGLSVLPRINGDDSVTMYIRPEVTDQGRLYKGPSGTEVPEQRIQRIQTNRRVKTGETIVLGGFIREEDSSNKQEVPFLSKLPIIGKLFQTHSGTADQRELLIFLTPRIIPDTAGAATGVRPQL